MANEEGARPVKPLVVTRRQFLLLSVAGVGLAACGAKSAPSADQQEANPTPHGTSTPTPAITPVTIAGVEITRQLIQDIVHEQLDYLTLDGAGVASFAKDYLRYAESLTDEAMVAAYLQALKEKQPAYIKEVAIFFLFSSDFSWKETDMDKTVYYNGLLYDAYRACSNPFAERLR